MSKDGLEIEIAATAGALSRLESTIRLIDQEVEEAEELKGRTNLLNLKKILQSRCSHYQALLDDHLSRIKSDSKPEPKQPEPKPKQPTNDLDSKEDKLAGAIADLIRCLGSYEYLQNAMRQINNNLKREQKNLLELLENTEKEVKEGNLSNLFEVGAKRKLIEIATQTALMQKVNISDKLAAAHTSTDLLFGIIINSERFSAYQSQRWFAPLLEGVQHVLGVDPSEDILPKQQPAVAAEPSPQSADSAAPTSPTSFLFPKPAPPSSPRPPVSQPPSTPRSGLVPSNSSRNLGLNASPSAGGSVRDVAARLQGTLTMVTPLQHQPRRLGSIGKEAADEPLPSVSVNAGRRGSSQQCNLTQAITQELKERTSVTPPQSQPPTPGGNGEGEAAQVGSTDNQNEVVRPAANPLAPASVHAENKKEMQHHTLNRARLLSNSRKPRTVRFSNQIQSSTSSEPADSSPSVLLP